MKTYQVILLGVFLFISSIPVKTENQVKESAVFINNTSNFEKK